MPSDDAVELRTVTVRSWDDVDHAPMLTGPEKDAVVTVLRDTRHDSLFILPDFKRDEDDHDVVRLNADSVIDVNANAGRLAVGYWENYSAKAVRVTQFHRKNNPDITGSNWGCYIPKSTTVVIEADGHLDSLDTPQRGLTDYTQSPDDSR
jgi:hypothetical protein